MKTFIFFAALSLLILAAACSTTTPTNTGNQAVVVTTNANSGAVNHANMNHGTMNANAPAVNSNVQTTNANQNPAETNHGSMNHSDMKSAQGAANAPFDLQFLDTMISHHEGAVEMAKLAETRGQRAELKTFAAKIITDQAREIAQMKTWREQWFKGQPSALNMELRGMADSMKMDMSKLAAASGNNFDLMFVQMMIPHHEGAVTMAGDAIRNTKRAEIKTLCTQILKAQDTEINQMQFWELEWKR